MRGYRSILKIAQVFAVILPFVDVVTHIQPRLENINVMPNSRRRQQTRQRENLTITILVSYEYLRHKAQRLTSSTVADITAKRGT